MRREVFGLALLVLVACDPDDMGTDSSVDAALDGGRDDGMVMDGGVVDDELPTTLSPLACQTDLTILREEDFEVRQHPLDHKGQVYGLRQEGAELVLRELVSDTELARGGQDVPGIPDRTLLFDTATTLAVAPDLGSDNDPDYPLAFEARMGGGGGGSVPFDVMLRSDGEGGLVKVVAEGDTVTIHQPALSLRGSSITGVVSSFGSLALAADGTAIFQLSLEGSSEQYLVRQQGPGAALVLIVGTTTTLDDTHRVGVIESFGLPSLDEPLVRVTVQAGATPVGFAYLRSEGGEHQCVLTDSPIECPGGISIPTGESVDFDDFSSDGLSTGAVFRGDPSSPSFRYRAGGRPGRGEPPATIERGVETLGFTFNNFKHPRACPRDGSLYFVGQLGASSGNPRDELMRVDASGTISQLTNFGSLTASDALVGEVPDEILDVALGYGCDAILRMRGEPIEGSTAPYEGYWVSYFGGDTMEIVEETPGRADNGNGLTMGITRSLSGIDPGMDWNTPSNVGPTGDFTLLLQKASGPVLSIYARATEPRDRCRAPNIVNSDGDADDVTAGDGRCDTGAMVGADPECTLRALIQETNAAPGSDLGRVDGPRTIRLGSPLPPITSALVFEGVSTVVNGEDLVGEEVGIEVSARNVELNGMRFEGFPSHGVLAHHYVQLDDVSSSSNCGWGMWLQAGASISGAVDAPAQVENNGAGDECTGGGLYLASEAVPTRIAYVRVNSNDGPGIATLAYIDTTGLEVSENRGDGIVADQEAFGATAGVRAVYGTIIARNNAGHGMFLSGGGIKTQVANVVAEGNCGWGLWIEDGPAELRSRYGRRPHLRHVMSNNGLTPVGGGGGAFFSFDASGTLTSDSRPCGGGGISVTALDPEDAMCRIDSVDIEDNQGPGIASTAGWLLGDVVVRANFGPGILVTPEEDDDFPSPDLSLIRFDEGRAPNVVSDNLGFGIKLVAGTVTVGAELTVEANIGAGIGVTEDGHVILNPEVRNVTTLRRNGMPALDCRTWTHSAGVWTQSPDAPCEANGGIYVRSGDVTANGAIIRDNAGPGITAADGDDEGDGTATVNGGEICDNGAPDVVVTMSYTDVDTCM